MPWFQTVMRNKEHRQLQWPLLHWFQPCPDQKNLNINNSDMKVKVRLKGDTES